MITVRIEEDFSTGDKLITARVPRRDLVEIELDAFELPEVNIMAG